MTFGWAKRPRRRLGKTSLLLFVTITSFLLFAFATPVTVTKANDASYAGTLIRPYFENANAPVTGCTAPCLTVDTQTTQPGTSNSFTLASAARMYLWSPQFTSATTAIAGTWSLDFWAAAASYTDVPVTLTNSQTAATPNPYQALIQPDPYTYSASESSDLGNVAFCTTATCTTELYSWLEGCGIAAPYGPCSTSSTLANFWVKLTSAIAANGGTLTIYMVFLPTSEFDGVQRGEAPQLSSTYGAFDNGANVFDLYFNGNTATSGFNLGANNALATANTANPIAGGATLNVLSLTGYGASNRVNMILTTALPAGNPSYGEIAESYSEIQNGDAGNLQGLAGFCDSTTPGSTTINAESEVVGASGTLYDYVYVANGAATKETGTGVDATLTWYYAALAYPGTGSTSFSGIVSTSFYPAYAASTPYYPISGSAHLYWCSVGSYVEGNPDGLYFNWGRARAYPPGGNAPTFVFGTYSVNTLSVTIYVTNSAGTSTAVVANGVASPLLSATKSETSMKFSAATVTVPANGYIEFVIVASTPACTVYWGAGQPTDFQVSFTSRTT